MKNFLYFLLSGMFAAAIFLGSCEKVVYPPVEIPDSVSYKTDIQPIWDAKCLNCHGGKYSPDLREEVSYGELIDGGYINTENPGESKLIKKFEGTHKGRVTEAEKASILVWIEQGAKNN
jgi:hypothetical protein